MFWDGFSRMGGLSHAGLPAPKSAERSDDGIVFCRGRLVVECGKYHYKSCISSVHKEILEEFPVFNLA